MANWKDGNGVILQADLLMVGGMKTQFKTAIRTEIMASETCLKLLQSRKQISTLSAYQTEHSSDYPNYVQS